MRRRHDRQTQPIHVGDVSEITTSRGGYEQHGVSSLPRGRGVSWPSCGTQPNNVAPNVDEKLQPTPPVPRRIGFRAASSTLGDAPWFPPGTQMVPAVQGVGVDTILALWCLGLCGRDDRRSGWGFIPAKERRSRANIPSPKDQRPHARGLLSVDLVEKISSSRGRCRRVGAQWIVSR